MSRSEYDLLVSFSRQRDQFWANAVEAINRREPRKATELIWGAVAQQIKAVAITRGKELGRHRQFAEFVKNLSHATGDLYFLEEYTILETLHNYFYDDRAFPGAEIQFPRYVARAERFIQRLQEYLPD